MKPKIFSIIICALLFICEIFSQGIPQTINFQGVLKDASGNIVSNGDYNLTFKIYNAETGGTPLWTETKLVNVVDGIFSTQLGSATPINLPFDAAYWLGITVGGGSELTPRVAFSSVPYSRMSLTVPDNSLTASKIQTGQLVKSINGLKDSINLVAGSNVTITPSGNDITISAASGAGGTVTQVNTGAGLTGGPITTTGTISIANDGITNAMLQNNSVTSTKIADGSVTVNDLSDSSVTSAKIVDGTVSTSDLANNSVTTDKIVDGTITATDIANTQVVKSINSLKDNVNLVAGSNVTITPSGNDITISASGGGGGTVTQVNTGSGLTGGPITTTGTISIANDGITNAMLQNNSVTSTKIADGSVTVNDLSDSSVTSAKIVDGTVSASDLANNSVTTDKVVDGTITATDIANTQVVKSINSLKDNVNLVAGSNVTITPSGQNLTISASGGGGGTVTQVNTGSGLTGGPITTTGTISIANDGITNAMLQNNSVTSAKITDGTIVEADLGNNSVTSAKILDATITSADITDNAITTAKILNDAVTTTKILNGTILFEDIGTNGATANQVIKRNASNTAWITAPDETGADYSWNLTGNAGTTPGTNFIGTTDANAFDIRTNNILRTRITTKGQIETYNTGLSVFVGQGAGANDDLSNNQNVFVGFNSGSLNTTGVYNTAAGYQSLYSNTTGYDNTAIGWGSLYSNTTGYFNTANGVDALHSNTTGNYNTANGMSALYSNTTGNENTANGMFALYSNVAGSNATAVGYDAMRYSNNRATPFTNYNVAVGYEALRGSTDASANTGNYNTSIGYQTLFSNTTGYYNTANGVQALFSNTTGNGNTANGMNALLSNTTGSCNTANGYLALHYNTTGSYNTANGMYSLNYITTQYHNTAIGFSAGDNYTFNEGTFVGSNAYPDNSGYTNCMGLGYNARPTGSNRVHIGNSSITWIGGQVNWSTYSDGRYKKNVREDVRGLDFIMKLRPVTYNVAVNEISAFLKEDQKRDKDGNITFETDEIDRKSREEKEAIRYTGFIAQEVEQAATELGFEFSGVEKPKDENNLYSLRYAEFVVPLVKAIQEQQKIIEDLTRRIEALERK